MNANQGDRPSLKSRIKKAMQARPAIWGRYWRTKQELKRLFMLRYFLYDIRHTYRFMFWPWAQREAWALSAELLFQYHKLEKGLVMPGKPRLFGLEPVAAVMNLLDRWMRAELPQQDPVFLGAIATLRSYLARLIDRQLDPQQVITPQVSQFLKRFDGMPALAELSTPYHPALPSTITEDQLSSAFDALANVRRSVRDFKPDLVPADVLTHAVSLAQLSPSACNRQPCSVILVDDPTKRKQLLDLQNGNKGFGHLAPHIAVITADERGFFDASERHEPYIDGGLFAMSLILALRANGVGSCCLNWCVTPSLDKAAHQVLGLNPACRIIMLIAVGYPQADEIVPRSPRRGTANILSRL
jgi:nitroreductase